MVQNNNGFDGLVHHSKDTIKKNVPSLSIDKFQDQFRIIYDGFFYQPQTMKELSVRRNIDRSNICWYCRTLRYSNRIAVLKKVRCSITHRVVNQYSTNPDLFPDNLQLKLF